MRQALMTAGMRPWLMGAMLALAAVFFGSVARAEDPGPEIIKQIKLTEAQIKGFIGAQPSMAKISEKMQSQTTDKPDPAIEAELETIAKANGFKDFAEYDDVAANISLVMASMDPQTGNYLDPVASIKAEIAEVTANATIPDNEKKERLQELNEALKTIQPVQFPDNIALIKKFRPEIEKVLQ